MSGQHRVIQGRTARHIAPALLAIVAMVGALLTFSSAASSASTPPLSVQALASLPAVGLAGSATPLAAGTSVAPGDTITYTLKATASGAVPAGATVVDDLSGLLDHASVTSTADQLANAGLTLDPKAKTLTWAVQPMNVAGQYQVTTFTVTVGSGTSENGASLTTTAAPTGGTCAAGAPCATDLKVVVPTPTPTTTPTSSSKAATTPSKPTTTTSSTPSKPTTTKAPTTHATPLSTDQVKKAVSAKTDTPSSNVEPLAALAALSCSAGVVYTVDANGTITQVTTATGTQTSAGTISRQSGQSLNGLGMSADGLYAFAVSNAPGPNQSVTVYRYNTVTGITTPTTFAGVALRGTGTFVMGGVNPATGIYYYADINSDTGNLDLYGFNTVSNTNLGYIGSVPATSDSNGRPRSNGDLVFSSTGQMYFVESSASGATDANVLLSLDQTIPTQGGTNPTLTATVIADLNPDDRAFNGIAFAGGYLYLDALDARGNPPATLYQVDPSTGQEITSHTLPSGTPVDMASCQFNNSLRVVKDIAGRFSSTDQFTLSTTANGTAIGSTGTTTGTTTGPQTGPGEVATSIPLSGQQIVVTEHGAAGANLANYTSTYSCVDQNNNVVTSGTGTSGRFTFPTGTTSGVNVTCTFTNTPVKHTPAISTTATGTATLPSGTVHDTATLTGYAAPATGSVTFTLYGPSATPTCTGTPAYTSTVSIAAGGTATSGSFTPTKAGNYYWIASYSGDANNNAVTGKCGDTGESSTVSPASPAISTSATAAQLPSGTIHDVASLTGLSSGATGKVTFALYGPSATPACTGTAIFTSTVDIAAGGTATSGSYTPTKAGNYYWIASYSGDANNNAVAGTCGNTGETSTVTPAGPSISTQATNAALPSGTISDTATLTGFTAPTTGTVTFDLYGPSATAACTGTPVFTATVNIGSNGTATSEPFTPKAAGNYYWIASYSGDPNNNAVTGHCGDTGETSTVSPASPAISTTATNAALPSGTISDTANLTGLTSGVTGTVTFTLYGPVSGTVGSGSCTAGNEITLGSSFTVPIGTVTSGAATVHSPGYTPTKAGSYLWIASYSGDPNNNAVAGTCGDAGETSTVSPASPSIATQATDAALPAGSISDSVTLSGFAAPVTGTVTFTLYGPSATADCSGTAVFTSPVNIGEDGTTISGSYTPTAAGRYYWIASYSGDANNNAVAGTCGDTGETSTVSPASPAISTTATNAALPSGTISDTANLTGLNSGATGTVTFTLYGPVSGTVGTGSCTAGNEITLGSSFTVPIGTVTGGAASVPSPGYTPTKAGTYLWIASYSGDANNSAVAGHCGDTGETSTVTPASPAISTSATASVALPGNPITDTATLSGATSDAGGTIVFTLYGPSATATCSTAIYTSVPVSVSGNGTYGGTPAVSYTPATAGTYYWIASYSGDANNSAVAGHCGDTGETSTVTPASPAISTQATNAALPTGTIHDSATLTGLNSGATGTVTFALYGPVSGTVGSDSCTAGNEITLGSSFTVDLGTVTGGAATVQSPGYTPTKAGTYLWIASYSGDANNNAVAGHCGDTGETSTVTPASPSISTAATASVALPGNPITDTATLSGATSDAGGTIVFTLYGPSATATCSTAIYTSSPVSVSGNGTYGGTPAVSYTPATAGTYYWIASYSGDANNNAVAGTCGDTGETSTVTPASPAISTQATNTALPGGTISDTATLTGFASPAGGKVTFTLYGPSATATCTGTPAFTSTVDIAADGTATSESFTPPTAGNYYWIASYSGDSNNQAVAGSCGDDGETSAVSLASPAIATSATAAQLPAGTIHDVATLTGFASPVGGTVTFTLYASATCTGTPAFTSQVTIGSDGTATSESFTPKTAGNYYWIAAYSGDPNNNPIAGNCGDANETSTVHPAGPSISTQATDAALPAGTIHDVATLTGFEAPVGGTVTFDLYGPAATATCTGTPVLTSTVTIGSDGTATSGSYTPKTAGNYYWVASYSGDPNNNPIAGTCGDTGETSIASPASPHISTSATGAALPAGTIHDVATLTGFASPVGGTVTFDLYGPSATATCTGDPAFTSTVTIGSDGTVTSGSFTPKSAGNYYWIATYNGDANNNGVAGTCGDTGETSTVTPATPTISTTATNAALPTGTIHDSATLTGLTSDATGTVTFTLYGPVSGTVGSDSCTAGIEITLGPSFTVDLGTVTGGAATVHSPEYLPTTVGTYLWKASYSGDHLNNNAVKGTCGDDGETSTVTPASPTIATTATTTLNPVPNGTITDTARLSGFEAPASGKVTFTLYGPSATADCSGTPVHTSTVNIAADGTATSGSYTPTEAGNYYWIASYSGDANNNAVQGNCSDEGETTVVNPVAPSQVKKFISATQNIVGGTWDGTWNVTYTVTVTNPSSTVGLTYSLTDNPEFPAGVTINGGTVSGHDNATPPNAITVENPTFTQTPVGIVADRTLAGGGVDTYTVTLNATVPPTQDPGTLQCQDDTPNQGFYNESDLTSGEFEIPPAHDCGTIPQVATPTVTKTVTSNTQNTDGTWTIVYDVAVNNPNADLWTTYGATDTLAFGNGITVNSAAVTGPGASSTWNGSTDTTIASGQYLAPSGTATYTVTVNATVTTDATTADQTCSAGGGFLNKAHVGLPETELGLMAGIRALDATDPGQDAQACAQPVSPEISKTAIGAVQHLTGGKWDGTWDVTYTISVSNPSTMHTALVYSLKDTPAFPSGVTVKSATVTGATDSANQPIPGVINTWKSGTLSIISDRNLAGATSDTYTVVVNAAVPPTQDPGTLQCQQGQSGHGFFNTGTETSGEESLSSTGCTDIPPMPAVTVDKTVRSSVQNPDGSWTVTYDVVARNSSTTLATMYSLSDALHFGKGITVTSAKVSGPGASAAWNGSTVTHVAGPLPMAAGGSASYTVTVVATVASTATAAARDCQLTTGETGTGFLNTATVTSGTTSEQASACAAPGSPAVAKKLVSIKAGATAGDWTVTYSVTVTNGTSTQVSYSLQDALGYPSAVKVTSTSVSRVHSGLDGSNPSAAQSVSWNGSGALATGQSLAAESMDTYTVTVQVTVPSSLPAAEATCSAAGAGHGYFNEATMTSGKDTFTSSACGTITPPAPPVIPPAPPTPPLAYTGVELAQWMAAALGLLMAGALLIVFGRRRRREDGRES